MESSIKFNGKTYSSIEQMPPDVRAQYERTSAIFVDEDKNGIPDIMEGRSGVSGGGALISALKWFASGTTTTNTFMSERIIINGKEYSSLDEVPPELQAKIREARAGHDDMGNLGGLFKRPKTVDDRNLQATGRTAKESPITDTDGNHFCAFIIKGLLVLAVLVALGVVKLPAIP